MGDKRVSQRTLDSGEVVTHYPPDDEHPEGKMELVEGDSVLRAAMVEAAPELQVQQDEIAMAQVAAIEDKRARQKRKGLPPEKSPV